MGLAGVMLGKRNLPMNNAISMGLVHIKSVMVHCPDAAYKVPLSASSEVGSKLRSIFGCVKVPHGR